MKTASCSCALCKTSSAINHVWLHCVRDCHSACAAYERIGPLLFQRARGGASIHLWNPERTNYMCPACVVRLFESSSLVGTERAVHGSTRRLQATATQPLALWDVGNAVALLVYRQVTHVTEQDDVAVLTLSVITDAAHSILIDQSTGVRLGEKKRERGIWISK